MATALHRLAKLQPPGTAGPQSPVLRSASFQLLVEASQRLVPRFEAQAVSNTLWGALPTPSHPKKTVPSLFLVRHCHGVGLDPVGWDMMMTLAWNRWDDVLTRSQQSSAVTDVLCTLNVQAPKAGRVLLVARFSRPFPCKRLLGPGTDLRSCDVQRLRRWATIRAGTCWTAWGTMQPALCAPSDHRPPAMPSGEPPHHMP